MYRSPGLLRRTVFGGTGEGGLHFRNFVLFRRLSSAWEATTIEPTTCGFTFIRDIGQMWIYPRMIPWNEGRVVIDGRKEAMAFFLQNLYLQTVQSVQ
jgi:hypothetical protein